MKKILSLFLCAALVALTLAACDTAPKQTVRVLSFGEYIADGKDGLLDVLEEFKKDTGINYTYEPIDNNEAMYAKLKTAASNYDVIVASDYLIAQLIDEEMVEKLDYDKIPNFKHIDEQYRNAAFDPTQAYSVPYTAGLVGLIYNTKFVKTAPTSWTALWDTQYNVDGKGKNLMIGNPRDAFAIAEAVLGYSYNTSDHEELRAAAAELIKQAPARYGFVNDEIFQLLEGGEVAMGAYYSGDFLTMHEKNPNLAFVYPKEGVNSFIDAFCILKGAQNRDAAHAYINYMNEPEIALENAEYLGYVSPHKAVFTNPDYTWYENEYLYPTKMPKTEAFNMQSKETRSLMNALFDEVRK
ncbi:MAG: spermidine/putrescine ABC transporter substrate-binding protein [Oscillospiraceae bacterium]|jgi:spermidine/putrescine transport system substrate-binding protein|nr:spermidine/putrescine ABC transporter substrate-binding protein [Oscillospiraceae bacterium]